MTPGATHPLPTRHYLLPHERYWAARLLRKHAARPDNKVVRQFQEQLGPEGIVLLAASQGGGILAAAIGLVGAAFLIAWGGRGLGLVVFYTFVCVALSSVTLAMVRNGQRSRAVKAFQADRRAAAGGPLIEQSS
jgi:hypothetical protein